MKQKLFHPIVGDKDVREAIAIIVVKRNAESFALHGGDSRLGAHVSKLPAAFVVVKNIRHAVELIGTAIGMERRSTKDVPADVPVEVACYKQVQAPVVIVIEESGRRRPAARSDARLRCDIRKSPVAVVAV